MANKVACPLFNRLTEFTQWLTDLSHLHLTNKAAFRDKLELTHSVIITMLRIGTEAIAVNSKEYY
jgi:hypothetical protein